MLPPKTETTLKGMHVICTDICHKMSVNMGMQLISYSNLLNTHVLAVNNL